MWEISLSHQIVSFLYAVLVGFIWAFVFDILRAVRKSRRHSHLIIFIEDFLSCLLFTFITFILLMARCNGEVRGYMLCGEVIGFAIFRLILSRFVVPIFTAIFSFLGNLFDVIGGYICCFGEFLEDKTNKLRQNLKKVLKKLKVMRKNS